MKFTQHVPGFCDGVEPFTIEGSLVEILEDHRIKKWANASNFHRWAVDRDGLSNGHCRLIVEQDKGEAWWVVGFLDEVPESLPEWTPIYV